MNHKIFALTVVLICLCAAPPRASAQVYGITDLGTLGGDASAAQGINSLGQVVGWSNTTSGGAHRAFFFSDGTMTDLGTLVGGTTSEAAAVNDAGQVIGVSGINAYGPGFREVMQGFIWQGGTMRSLGALYCYCSFNTRYGTSAAYAVNNGAQIVGQSEATAHGSWAPHATLWQPGAMQDISGAVGADWYWSISHAFGINDLGQVVGDFAQDAVLLQVVTYDRRAFLWQSGTRQDLGTLPGYSSSTALAINKNGQVVGWSGAADASSAHAFVWDSGAMQDLGTLPGDPNSQALGINGPGQVVGWSGTESATARAFLWQSGVMLDLNDLLPMGSGWVLTQAAGINDRGQIAGTGLHDGQVRAFLLNPKITIGVPEIPVTAPFAATIK